MKGRELEPEKQREQRRFVRAITRRARKGELNVYEGVVPAEVKRQRRARNKRARKARQLNRRRA